MPRYHSLIGVVLALLVGPPVFSAAVASADATPLTRADTRDAIDVKFAEGSAVRLRHRRLVSEGQGRIAALDDVFGRFDDVDVTRLFASTSEADLDAARREAHSRSGNAQENLNLFFRIHTGRAADTAALLDALNALDIVEYATPVATAPPPPLTPSFVASQGYRAAAAGGGIDADYAHTLPGGKGEGISIVDIEYSWNRTHEDLSKARAAGSALAGGTPCDPFAGSASATDHGTAVLGELGGDPNGIGVTGLVPAATLRTVNAARINVNGGCERNLPNAIQLAADSTSRGDVILLEQQSVGPRWPGGDTQFGYVPVEFDPVVREAIESATDRGRIVVEAAGNGSQNLDDPVYGSRFATDSGAIVVGAGSAPGCTRAGEATVARGRLSFSNHGGIVDLQGWGNCVTTTGYGGLHGTNGSDDAYTATFGGTSSASPIVAASAAVLSGIAKSRGTTLTAAQARALLASTGQPQAAGLAGNIGPLPDLRAAIGALGPRPAEAERVVEGASLTGATVPVRQSWTSTGGAVRYEVWLRTDGGTWARQSQTGASAVFALERNRRHQFAVRAADAAGVWSEFAYGSEFHLGAYEEDYSAANPAFAGTWTRAPWQSASGGQLSVSGTAGDRAAFTFTGTSVAWIATKATNRGQAHVYVDGVFAKTVDLYAASNLPQAIAFTRSWAQAGTHTIEVRVAGTSGRSKVDVDAFVRLK